jgi:NADH:ubiquinone oxidoreductase subunit 6 (subunit J)
MELKEIIFLLIAGITVFSGWLVVSLKNIIHSAFSLLVTFFGVSGLFIYLHADFLAATQILIYIGGVMILILFSIMLSEKVYNLPLLHWSKLLPAVLILGVLPFILSRVILETHWKVRAEGLDITGPTTGVLGELLLSEYLLPFEVISVMLLAGLVGAVVLIRKEVGKAGREEMF